MLALIQVKYYLAPLFEVAEYVTSFTDFNLRFNQTSYFKLSVGISSYFIYLIKRESITYNVPS